MIVREQIKRSLQKDKQSRLPYFVRAYNQHFDGYTEAACEQSNGKIRISRTYISPYYLQDISLKSCILLKAIYVLLIVFSASFFVINAAKPHVGNLLWVSSIFQSFSVAALFWVFTGVCCMLPLRRKMKIAAYRCASLRIKHASLTAAFCLLGCALCMLVCAASGSGDSEQGLGICVGYLLCTAVMLLLRLLESKVNYIKLENGE